MSLTQHAPYVIAGSLVACVALQQAGDGLLVWQELDPALAASVHALDPNAMRFDTPRLFDYIFCCHNCSRKGFLIHMDRIHVVITGCPHTYT